MIRQLLTYLRIQIGNEPGYGKKTKRNQAAQDGQRIIFVAGVGENLGENEGQHAHHDERIQKGPENA
jgi:hypothetical protein